MFCKDLVLKAKRTKINIHSAKIHSTRTDSMSFILNTGLSLFWQVFWFCTLEGWINNICFSLIKSNRALKVKVKYERSCLHVYCLHVVLLLNCICTFVFLLFVSELPYFVHRWRWCCTNFHLIAKSY